LIGGRAGRSDRWRNAIARPCEDFWLFLRQNHLSNRVFKNYDDIRDACCAARNALAATPMSIASIVARDRVSFIPYCRWYWRRRAVYKRSFRESTPNYYLSHIPDAVETSANRWNFIGV